MNFTINTLKKVKVEVIKMNENKTNINWYPGHMAKTKREIKEKIDLIDLVYEVIDARMPISSKMQDIDNILKEKPRILIATKYDLCDKQVTERLLDQYRNAGHIVVTCDLMKDKNLNTLMEKSKEVFEKQQLLRKEKGLKERAMRILIIGVPNVGKSTLINRLVGRKATVTGNKPGVTKTLGWIRIHKDMELLDSPGILWPKLENQEQAHILASLSSIKEDILNLDELAIFILEKMNQLYPERLKERYGIESIDFAKIEETFDLIAQKRGALLKGGVTDYDKVYTIIIRDLKEGYLGPVTLDR